MPNSEIKLHRNIVANHRVTVMRFTLMTNAESAHANYVSLDLAPALSRQFPHELNSERYRAVVKLMVYRV